MIGSPTQEKFSGRNPVSQLADRDQSATHREGNMALDPKVKKNWEEIQKKHGQPVNAIGIPIKPGEVAMLKVWKDEGIDKFVKK